MHFIFVSQQRCTSFIGKIGGAQTVTLGSGCADNSGVVEHEFMHAVGFEHVQQRYDRDSYIFVNMPNVIKGIFVNIHLKCLGIQYIIAFTTGNEGAFSKDSSVGRQLLGTPYDTRIKTLTK